ncbi:hypothetical protein OK17_18250 [Gordonia sp. GN26]
MGTQVGESIVLIFQCHKALPFSGFVCVECLLRRGDIAQFGGYGEHFVAQLIESFGEFCRCRTDVAEGVSACLCRVSVPHAVQNCVNMLSGWEVDGLQHGTEVQFVGVEQLVSGRDR